MMKDSKSPVLHRRRNFWICVFAVTWVIAVVAVALGIPHEITPLVGFLWATFAFGFLATVLAIYYGFRSRAESHDT